MRKPFGSWKMKGKKICMNCQYFRQPGPSAMDIPGEGTWCSNSQSLRNRTRVGNDDTCPLFYQRGKKAPISLRLKVASLGLANKALYRISKKRGL